MPRIGRTALRTFVAFVLPLLAVVAIPAATSSVGATTTTPAVGAMVVLNPTGGYSTTDGLQIVYQGGQFQIERDGSGQVYYPGYTATSPNSSLYNAVAMTIGTGATAVAVYPYRLYRPTYDYTATIKTWTTITTVKDSTTQFHSTLTTTVAGRTYSLVVTVTYVAPADHFTVNYHLTLPAGASGKIRIYHLIDTFLGGSDHGAGFYDAAESCRGATVGVNGSTGSVVEAFSHKAGPTWAGYASTTFTSVVFGGTSWGPGFGTTLPDTITANPGTDNGIGVNWKITATTTTSAFTATNELTFARNLSACTSSISTTAPAPSPTTSTTSTTAIPGNGYWMSASDGGVFAFGDAKFYGSLPRDHVTPTSAIVGIAATPNHKGYWLVGADGGVFAFGDAWWWGSLPSVDIRPTAPIVGIVPTSDGGGYWLVAADGGVFAFGDAHWYGSLAGILLNAKITAMAASPDDNGYFLVAADGGVFAFGDARYYGSLPGSGVSDHGSIESIVTSPDGHGYWLIGTDGGVFGYGDTNWIGSIPAIPSVHLDAPVVAASGRSRTDGFWLAGAQGGAFAFGTTFRGSLPLLEIRPDAPITGIAGYYDTAN